MSASEAAVPLETLLAHREWVRALAMALTRDEHEAADVEQQTWLAAVKSPPRTGESPRGWLGTVARNAARKRGRSAGRRRARERRVARSEASPGADPAELAARADLHAKVAAAVVAMAEPYRQALLLRYFEGLAVGEVAARMDAPVETTRARLRRGREQLRGRLQRDVGRGRPLAVVLLPLLDRESLAASGGAAVVAAGGMTMASKVALGTAAALLLVAGIWWGTQGGDGDERVETSAVPEASVPVDASEPEPEPEPVSGPPRPERPRVRAPGPEEPEELVDEPVVEEESPKSAKDALMTPIESMKFQGEKLREVLAELSDVTGVAIHVDQRREKDLDNVPIHMQMEGIPAGTMLQVMARVSGMEMVVEEQRVVLHGAKDTWSPDLPTAVIEPASRDPDAPQTITVHGRVLDASGLAVEGATILHARAEVGTSDAAGEYSVEVGRPFSFVFARVAGFQDAPFVQVRGEPGDEIEADLVIGAPAGAAVVRVTSSSGDAPKMAQVRFRWVVPGEMRVGRDGKGRRQQRHASAVARDGETVTFEWLPPGEMELRVSAKGHVRDVRTVEITEAGRLDLDVELRRVDVADRLRDERISFDVTDEPVHRLLARIRLQTSLDVTFAGETAAEVFDARISLKVSNDSIESALRAICQALPGTVTWKIQGDVVVLFQR